ncbi:MAG: DUF1499 domain-containing protein [Pseudomonadota bacterium]
MENSLEQGKPQRSRVALWGFALAVAGAVAALLAGYGTRLGWWPFAMGFTLLKWAAYGAVAAIALSLAGLFMARRRGRRGAAWAGIGLVIALLVVLVPLNYLRLARAVPPIHDITTDTQNPPRFVAILPLRKNAPNSAEYGGAAVAAQQAKAYPHIAPALLDAPPAQAFQRALNAAQEMGWAIVEENPLDGRIEATATTRWFGFKDDVVIRVTPARQGSRVDVRSVSRVGVSDLGTNARRIEAYLKKLKETH